MQLAISTFGKKGLERAARMLLPRVPWLGYVVSWQMPEGEIPPALRRDDVKVVTLGTLGLARNRNNALAYCNADVVLNTDDDVAYDLAALRRILEIFEHNPAIDYLLFKFDGSVPHRYPPATTVVERDTHLGYSPCTIEIAVRLKSIRECGVSYDERFGLKSPRYHAGEDSILLATMRRRGLRGMFIPITACTHPQQSTGERRVSDSGSVLADGVFIGFEFPLSGLLRVPLKAWRMFRAGRWQFHKSLWWLYRGYIESFFIRKPWQN